MDKLIYAWKHFVDKNIPYVGFIGGEVTLLVSKGLCPCIRSSGGFGNQYLQVDRHYDLGVFILFVGLQRKTEYQLLFSNKL